MTPPEGEPATRIRALRNKRGVSQRALAEAVGCSLSTIRRLESGQLGSDAELGLLVNVAFALGAEDVAEILEPDWLRWRASDQAPRPPAREFFWRQRPEDAPLRSGDESPRRFGA